MSEEEILEEVFDKPALKWKGKYKVEWCGLCDSFIIGCIEPGCIGSSCNGHSCMLCHEDHLDFHKARTCVEAYLNDKERKVYEKIWWLKRYIKDSLKHGEYEINWKRLKEDGELSQRAEDIFAKEIKEYYDTRGNDNSK